MDQYLPLGSDEHLKESEKLILMEGTIKLLEKKDISINRRVYKWVFGGDVDNEIIINEENKMGFSMIVNSLKNIFMYKGESTFNDSLLPFKIMTNMFIEHEELTEIILKELAYPCLIYFYDSVHNSNIRDE